MISVTNCNWQLVPIIIWCDFEETIRQRVVEMVEDHLNCSRINWLKKWRLKTTVKFRFWTKMNEYISNGFVLTNQSRFLLKNNTKVKFSSLISNFEPSICPKFVHLFLQWNQHNYGMLCDSWPETQSVVWNLYSTVSRQKLSWSSWEKEASKCVK